jgi:hypothetical protein
MKNLRLHTEQLEQPLLSNGRKSVREYDGG